MLAGTNTVHSVLELIDFTRVTLSGVQTDVLCSGGHCSPQPPYPIIVDVIITDDYPKPFLSAQASLASDPSHLLWTTTSDYRLELPDALTLGVGCIGGELPFSYGDLDWRDRTDPNFQKSTVVLTPRSHVPELAVRQITPESTPFPLAPAPTCTGVPLDPAHIAAITEPDSKIQLTSPSVAHTRKCDVRRGGCTPWATYPSSTRVRLYNNALGRFYAAFNASAPGHGGLGGGLAPVDSSGDLFRSRDEGVQGSTEIVTVKGAVHPGCIWAEVTDTLRWSNGGASTRQGRDYHFVVDAHDPSIQ